VAKQKDRGWEQLFSGKTLQKSQGWQISRLKEGRGFFEVGRRSFGASANEGELVQRQLQENNVGGNVQHFFQLYHKPVDSTSHILYTRQLFPEALNCEV